MKTKENNNLSEEMDKMYKKWLKVTSKYKEECSILQMYVSWKYGSTMLPLPDHNVTKHSLKSALSRSMMIDTYYDEKTGEKRVELVQTFKYPKQDKHTKKFIFGRAEERLNLLTGDIIDITNLK